VSRRIQLREILAAVEGIALFRGLFSGSDEAAQARIDELHRILARSDREPGATAIVDVQEGYARWSTTYDAPGNPLVAAEQSPVWELIDQSPPGRALDAACGTGRHARHLVQSGWTVTGTDQSEAMLARAAERVPGAEFVLADLSELPFEDASFDLAVCSLALEHFPKLEPPIRELARVVRAGGRVVISESHPALRALGGAPYFEDADGASGVVRTHLHLHADYLDAFAAAGLVVSRCREIRFAAEQVAMQQPMASIYPEATEAAFLGFPAVLIWDVAKVG
jgi:ubiquinone/menaquinone biosynthesis C-methylase UbiE